jgi:hypothetical protein
MASNIDPSNIDGTYPLEGVNNDSQGFRTNFTNTAANLTEAKTEIEELQSKSIIKSALIGEAADNTLTIPLNTAASTTAAAGLNIAEGIAPTSPIDGDIWVTAAGAINVRLNGVTVDLTASPDANVVDPELVFTEQADHVFTPVATRGVVWVRSDTPNVLIFTDDDGTDWILNTSGGGDVTKVGTPVNNQVGIWTGDGTIEGSDRFTFDGNNTFNLGGGISVAPTLELDVGVGGNTLMRFMEAGSLRASIHYLDFSGIFQIKSQLVSTTLQLQAGSGPVVDLEDDGSLRIGAGIRFAERADHVETPAATFGELWLRSDTPNVLVFTDDAGTDHELGTGAAVTGVPADDQIAVWTGAGAIEGTGFAKITGLTGSSPTLELDGFTNVAHRYPTLLLNYDASDYGSIEFQEEGATRGHIRYYATGPSGGTDVLRIWNFLNGGADTNSMVEIGADNRLIMQASELGAYFPLPLQMAESVDHSYTPTAGRGEIWIRDDAPNTLMFTDDTGVDYAVAGAAANGLPAGGTEGQILVKQSATTGDATWEDFGSIPASATEYFPGYNYSQSTTSIFTVDLVDAANLFYVGRRVKFDKAGVFTYGDITAVDFNSTNANDTTVTVSGTPVPADPFDVALVTSATAWSAIATDPFGGSQINDIAGGQIGATYYLIACGALGKIAYSTDGGLTWTAVTPAQSNELLQIAYDPDVQRFMIAGKSATIMKSTDGVIWSEDSTALRALGGSDPRDPYLVYDQELNTFAISINLTGTSYRNFDSTDFAASWSSRDSNIASGIATKMRYLQVFIGTEYLYQPINNAVYVFDNAQDTVVGQGMIDATSGTINDIFAFVDNANNDVIAIAHDNGDVTFYDSTSPTLSLLSRDDISLGGNALYGVAYSPLHNRTVVVGANGTIGYCNDADTSTNDSVVGVANGFAPSNSGQFIAAADNGQICRSSNGTN